MNTAVAYHGGRTEEFLAEAPAVTGPLLMHLADEDEFISKEAQHAIIAALKDKPIVNIYTYPGCSHAFARHGGTHYDAEAAQQAAARTLSFFRSNLEVLGPVS